MIALISPFKVAEEEEQYKRRLDKVKRLENY